MGPLDTASRRVEVQPAYGVVVDHLRRAIHLGTYTAGEKLPPEREHAKELGVSRVTLREALRVLEGEGYLKIRRGASGGATVVARGESKAHLRQRLGELLAIQEFRQANESLSASRAAERATEADLEALAVTIDAIRDNPTLEQFRRADSEFHLFLAAIADCDLLQKAVEEARAAMFPQLDVVTLEAITSSAIRGHGQILDALRAHDPKRVKQRMEAHIKTTTKELLAVLAEEDPPSGGRNRRPAA